MTYWLYKLRNKHAALPKEFAKVHIGKSVSFLVLEREASYEEIEYCDLEYIGHSMTAEIVNEKINRSDY